METKKAIPQILRNPRDREKTPKRSRRTSTPARCAHHITPKGSPSPSRQVSARRHCGVTPSRLKCRSPWAARPVPAPQGRLQVPFALAEEDVQRRVNGKRKAKPRPHSHLHPPPNRSISSGLVRLLGLPPTPGSSETAPVVRPRSIPFLVASPLLGPSPSPSPHF